MSTADMTSGKMPELPEAALMVADSTVGGNDWPLTAYYTADQMHAYARAYADARAAEDAKDAAVMEWSPCEWTAADDGLRDYWETGCGLAFCFEDGGSPTANNFMFCHGCGKPISIAAIKESANGR